MIRSAAAALGVALLLAATTSPRARADEPVAPAAAPAAAPAVEAHAVAFEPATTPWADLVAKSKATGKPIFVDFFTEWCGWCKKLDKDTYSQASVAEAMKAFLPVQIDAEKGEGVELAKRYGARGFPTLVVVGADEQEVDRIVGYLAPEPFLKEVARIVSGEGTLPVLRQAVADRPDDLGAALALAKKLSAGGAPDAPERLADLVERAKGKDAEIEAGALLLLGRAVLSRPLPLDPKATPKERAEAVAVRTKDALVHLDRVALELGGTDAARDATRTAISLRAGGRDGDPADALAFAAKARAAAKDGTLDGPTEQVVANLHVRAAELALGRAAAAAGDDAQKLNALAWSCVERRLALAPATEWARRAVEKSGRDPQILDTLANLLALQKKHDEAISTELEALGKLAATDVAMRRDFLRNVARWTEERDAAAADGAGAGGKKSVPATKLAPAAPAAAK